MCIRDSVPESVVPADDEASDTACEGVKTVGIQRLRALTSRSRGSGSAGRIASTLVFAPLASALEVEGDPEAEARADLVLEVRQVGCRPRRRRQDPSASPGATTGPETRPRRIRQTLKEAPASRLSPSPAKKPLAPSQRRSFVLPAPSRGGWFARDLAGVVQVYPFRRELLHSSAESGGPGFSAPGDDISRSQPGAGQRPDSRESSEPRPKPSLCPQILEAQHSATPKASRQSRLKRERERERERDRERDTTGTRESVSYTHLTLPTSDLV